MDIGEYSDSRLRRQIRAYKERPALPMFDEKFISQIDYAIGGVFFSVKPKIEDKDIVSLNIPKAHTGVARIETL